MNESVNFFGKRGELLLKFCPTISAQEIKQTSKKIKK